MLYSQVGGGMRNRVILQLANIVREMGLNSLRTICWLCAMASVLPATVMQDDGQQQEQQEQQTKQQQPQQPLTIAEMQKQNIDTLNAALIRGWREFCNAPVDEGIMSLYNGINPSDASIYVMTINNQSIELPISYIGNITDFDVSPARPTLLYINAFYTPHTYFTVYEHLQLLQQSRRDLNIIILDFARTVQQLYFTIRHHTSVLSYFVFRVLNTLQAHGIAASDITLAGHSVGANIAALGADMWAAQQGRNSSAGASKRVGQLIAIDPAVMCRPSDMHMRANVSERVVVIHGDDQLFSMRAALGTIDIYLNDVANVNGYLPREKYQPGCDSSLCSHMYPFVLFMEALIEGVVIPAINCNNWSQFRLDACNGDDIVVVGLKYSPVAKGKYFCMTQSSPPFTYMEHGLKYRRQLTGAKRIKLVRQ